mgnify:CR=1 FL=1
MKMRAIQRSWLTGLVAFVVLIAAVLLFWSMHGWRLFVPHQSRKALSSDIELRLLSEWINSQPEGVLYRKDVHQYIPSPSLEAIGAEYALKVGSVTELTFSTGRGQLGMLTLIYSNQAVELDKRLRSIRKTRQFLIWKLGHEFYIVIAR